MNESNGTALRFYNFLCGKFGTMEVVKTRRMYFATKDYITQKKTLAMISSGSKGEGLDMKTSDFDIMLFVKDWHILDTLPETSIVNPNTFVMLNNDTKPGYTQLKLCSFMHDILKRIFCVSLGQEYYLSSERLKNFYLSTLTYSTVKINTIHGPCISSEDESFDFAYCFRCQTWINQAQRWKERNRVWPSSAVVSNVVSFGVLFVPIGCKNSPNEDIEWRISFSIAEKQLIFSFNHTQMLCYALLKVMLKEVIEKNTSLKELLCSYFLKTVMFWVSEEAPVTAWKPSKVLVCFMNCFKKLIYCVKYSSLPHYFITENNLFQDRFSSQKYIELNSTLKELYEIGPSFFIYSDTLHDFFENEYTFPSAVISCKYDNFLTLFNLVRDLHSTDVRYLNGNISKILENILNLCKKKQLSFPSDVLIGQLCRDISREQAVTFSVEGCNKYHYHKHKQFLPGILLGLQSDAVSGWINLAMYFYHCHQFASCLKTVSYAFSKFTPDKVYYSDRKLNVYHLNFTEHEVLHFYNFNCTGFYRRHVIEPVTFTSDTSLILNEMKIELEHKHVIFKPPDVFAHFLRFLCFYKLLQFSNCENSLHELRLLIRDNFFIWNEIMKAESFVCLGMEYYMLRRPNTAKALFLLSSRLDKGQESFVNHMLCKIMNNM